MPNALDLTTLQRVKSWLGLNALVSTTVAAAIGTGLQTVTPATMAGIAAGVLLAIDADPNQEIVQVLSITQTSFTALFAISHSTGAVVVLASDVIVPQLITSAGMDWLTMTGLAGDNGIPTVSPLVQICSVNEWYDGSGSFRQFVRTPPVASVVLVTINGVVVRQSTGFAVPGWVIDGGGSSIALRGGGVAFSGLLRSPGWCGSFLSGTQNVNLQYNGGFARTPFDVVQACTEMVGLTFRKRQWIGQKSQAMAQAGGSTTYVDWAIEPNVQRVISNYSRKAMV